jgi:hypothetical protein
MEDEMTESIPDPAENRPSQAEGAPEDEHVDSAVDPADNKPSQAEGDGSEGAAS